MTHDLTPFAQDPAATSVLDLMRGGRWRKARDAAKELCKRERARYLPLLIESNVGLVREMLAKGLVREAHTVVDYLASFAPSTVLAMLRAEIAAPVAKRTPADPAKADAADWWAATLRVDEALSTPKPTSPADLAAIDLLASDSFLPPVTHGDEREQRLAVELAAVRVAMDATGDGRWDQAREALRALPRLSVFRHWKMFLRGIRCLFEDQLETARQCFSTLPPHGALARAARAFDPGLTPPGPLAPASARVPVYLAATVQPAAWSGPILAAVASWKAGKRVQAFEDLLTGMKGSFPTSEPGLPADLTESALPFRGHMNDADFSDGEKLIDHLGLERGIKNRYTPDALLAVMRPMCLAEANEIEPGELDRYWRTVIELWNRCEGADPVRDAVAWHWLGEALGKTPSGPLSFFEPPGANLGKARKAFEKAVECDPSREVAWLSLLTLLARQGDTKTRNRLLDDLVKRFPRNKAILMEAATCAMERKALDKCLVLLEAALALDPLDKTVKQHMLVALVQLTREWLRKKRPVTPLWARMEPLLEDRPGPGFFMLSRWMSRVRQSLLDPDPETARQARTDADRMAPSHLERLFLEDVLAAVYRIEPRHDGSREWQEARDERDPGWGIFSNLLDILAFVSQIKGWGLRENSRASGSVLGVLAGLLDGKSLKDPDGLLVFIDHTEMLRKQKHTTDLAWEVVMLCFRDLSDWLERHASPGKRKVDPRLRLASLILRERDGISFHMSDQAFLKNLDAVIDDASACGMPAAVARARALRDRFERGPQPGDFDRTFDPDDDWDDDWDDDGFEAAMSGGMDVLIEALKKAIADQDAAAIRKARNALHECGITDEMLEPLMRVFEPPPPAPPPPQPRARKPGKPPRPPFVDPNQPDLF